MTTPEMLTTIAMEECAEVSQRLSKALRFGMEESQAQAGHGVTGAADESLTNSERIMIEFHDLVAVMEMMGLHPRSLDDEMILAKKQKVAGFLNYSIKCGALTP